MGALADIVRKELPRDGDGDGFIYDGTARVQPAPSRQPRARVARTGRLSPADLPNPTMEGRRNFDLREEQDRRLAWSAEEAGLRPEELRDRETERVRRLLHPSTARVVVRVTGGALASILRQGRFKTQHEVRRSKGHLDPTHRAELEKDRFGVPEDSDPALRPVYGYVTDDGEPVHRAGGFLMQYGDVVVVLKDDVRPRTTVTGGDSLDDDAVGSAPIDEADWRIGTWDEHSLRSPGLLDGVERLSESNRYVEAQVHGGVHLEDIAHVVFGTPPEPKLRRLLERKGVRFTVKDEGKRRATLWWIRAEESSRRSKEASAKKVEDLRAGRYQFVSYLYHTPKDGSERDWDVPGVPDKVFSRDVYPHAYVPVTEAESLRIEIEKAEQGVVTAAKAEEDARAKREEYGALYDAGRLREFRDVKSMSTAKLSEWHIELLLRRLAGESVEHLIKESDAEGGSRGRRGSEGVGIVVPGESPSARAKWDVRARKVYDRLVEEGVALPDWGDEAMFRRPGGVRWRG